MLLSIKGMVGITPKKTRKTLEDTDHCDRENKQEAVFINLHFCPCQLSICGRIFWFESDFGGASR